ncbi:MAG: ATP-binding protein [Prolixibacteraceae bacterium]
MGNLQKNEIKLLIIEDDPDDLLLLKDKLEGSASIKFILHTAKNLSEGIELSSVEKPDLILLDLGLVGSRGLETFSQFLNFGLNIPVVVLTGLTDEESALSAIQMGAEDYLVKSDLNGNLLQKTILYSIERFSLRQDLVEQHQELVKIEQQTENIINNTISGLTIINPEGRIVFVNPAAEKIFEKTKEELINFEIGYPVDTERTVTIQVLSKNRQVKTVELKTSSTQWYGEECKLISMNDISERQKYQEEVEKINAKLVEANQSKDRFLSIIGHDLKSPFSALLGYFAIFIDDSDSFSKAELKEIYIELHDSLNNLYKLITNLLDWSMVQSGKMKFDTQELWVSDLIAKTVHSFKLAAANKKITIKTELDHDNDTVYADPHASSTVIRNLISNALKFTNENGEIVVSTIAEKDFLRILIRDNGIGMAKSNLDNLFKIDIKISTTGTSGEKGTGLGLVLCKELVEKSGGSLQVKSVVNEGTEISFTLPRVIIKNHSPQLAISSQQSD